MDIRHFYDTIDISVLKRMLAKRINDEKFLAVLFTVLEVRPTGLPIGFYTSGWLANWLLNEMDHVIKERLGAVYYIRYADDIMIKVYVRLILLGKMTLADVPEKWRSDVEKALKEREA